MWPSDEDETISEGSDNGRQVSEIIWITNSLVEAVANDNMRADTSAAALRERIDSRNRAQPRMPIQIVEQPAFKEYSNQNPPSPVPPKPVSAD